MGLRHSCDLFQSKLLRRGAVVKFYSLQAKKRRPIVSATMSADWPSSEHVLSAFSVFLAVGVNGA